MPSAAEIFSQTRPIEFSIVVPVYNEQESLRELFSELLQILTPLNRPYEVIFVNDLSNDASLSIIEEFIQNFPEVVRVINLQKRSGQTFAMRTGLDAARGNFAVTLDADLQNDPADIPKMLKKLIDEKYDCVCGWRRSRQDTPLKAGLSKAGNVVQRLFTGAKIHDVSCTLRVYRRNCVSKIPLNWEGQHRFIPLCLSMQGLKVGEVESNHRRRKYGYTKYSHKRIFRVITDFFKILSAKGRA
jgi:dolichol-phosphate mannosyltransferase